MQLTFRFLCLALVMLAASCASDSSKEDAQDQILMSASAAFTHLMEAHQVPDLTRNEIKDSSTYPLKQEAAVTYPYTVVVDVTKKGDASDYNYYLTRDSSTATWRLTAAWLIPADGLPKSLKIE
jgi:ABC-type molybdate transport system substrate-binding protein